MRRALGVEASGGGPPRYARPPLGDRIFERGPIDLDSVPASGLYAAAVGHARRDEPKREENEGSMGEQ